MSRLLANGALIGVFALGSAIYFGGVLNSSEIACDRAEVRETLIRILKQNTDVGIRAMFFGGAARDEQGNPVPVAVLSTQTLDLSSSTVSRCRAVIQLPDIQGRVTTGVAYTVQKTDDGQISVTLYRG